MTHLTIPDELDKRLSALAEQAHVPKNEYALHALEEFLEDQEDYLVALSRSERMEKGIDKPLSFEEVLKELGLAEKSKH
jgi:RHH-type rel operon transcriptional repressor/antitoxin RelB